MIIANEVVRLTPEALQRYNEGFETPEEREQRQERAREAVKLAREEEERQAFEQERQRTADIEAIAARTAALVVGALARSRLESPGTRRRRCPSRSSSRPTSPTLLMTARTSPLMSSASGTESAEARSTSSGAPKPVRRASLRGSRPESVEGLSAYGGASGKPATDQPGAAEGAVSRPTRISL